MKIKDLFKKIHMNSQANGNWSDLKPQSSTSLPSLKRRKLDLVASISQALVSEGVSKTEEYYEFLEKCELSKNYKSVDQIEERRVVRECYERFNLNTFEHHVSEALLILIDIAESVNFDIKLGIDLEADTDSVDLMLNKQSVLEDRDYLVYRIIEKIPTLLEGDSLANSLLEFQHEVNMILRLGGPRIVEYTLNKLRYDQTLN